MTDLQPRPQPCKRGKACTYPYCHEQRTPGDDGCSYYIAALIAKNSAREPA